MASVAEKTTLQSAKTPEEVGADFYQRWSKKLDAEMGKRMDREMDERVDRESIEKDILEWYRLSRDFYTFEYIDDPAEEDP